MPQSLSESNAASAKRGKGTLQITAKKLAKAAVTPVEAKPRDNELIATAAYYLAEHRGFEPGHELDDWLTAEQRFRGLQSQSRM